MMIGITSWQQQVPIPQSYTGTNSWSIPLQPAYAQIPLSTKANLMKGAVAIAVNGIPIFNALNNKSIPIYGNGKNVREWIYVKDHCDALIKIAQKGVLGENYNIGSGIVLNNIEITKKIISVFERQININLNYLRIFLILSSIVFLLVAPMICSPRARSIAVPLVAGCFKPSVHSDLLRILVSGVPASLALET